MPKLNFDVELRDARGNIIYHEPAAGAGIAEPSKKKGGKKPAEKQKPKKLSDFIIDGMLLDNSRELTKEKKLERARIAFKTGAGGRQDYTVEELTEIKDVVGRGYGPLVYGRLCEAIDK